MMTPEKRDPHQSALEEIVRVAKEAALEHGGHVPTLIARGSRGSVVGQMPDMPETYEGRRRWMFSAGMALAQSNQVGTLEQVFFISEGWVSLAPRDSTLETLPSQDPDRKEVLFISSLAVGERGPDLILFKMVRDSQGQLAELERLEQPGEDDRGYVASPLLNAFAEGFRMGTRSLN